MAGFTDILVLLTTVVVIAAIIYGVVYFANSISEGLNSTKETLKSKGLNISSTGVSVKTSQRYTREDQIDAAQRHIIRAMGAASFRKGEAPQVPVVAEDLRMQRQGSNKSTSSTKSGNGEEKDKKKKRLFRSSK